MITTDIIVQKEEKQDDEASARRKSLADSTTRGAETYNEEQRTSSEVPMAARVFNRTDCDFIAMDARLDTN
jgi:hypothetical protein